MEPVRIADPANDYHGHPNYNKVALYLFALLAVSLLVGYVLSPMAALIVIFVTAAWKTTLVVRNFLHLRFEPVLVWIGVAAVVFCLVAFFFGIYPDITATNLDVVPR